jgi:hypothetical protein
VRGRMPLGSQMVAKVQKPTMAATMPAIKPADSRPVSKVRSAGVKERWASQPATPELPAVVKSRTQEPMVKASAMIAAVAEESEIDAANSAIAPISRP